MAVLRGADGDAGSGTQGVEDAFAVFAGGVGAESRGIRGVDGRDRGRCRPRSGSYFAMSAIFVAGQGIDLAILKPIYEFR